MGNAWKSPVNEGYICEKRSSNSMLHFLASHIWLPQSGGIEEHMREKMRKCIFHTRCPLITWWLQSVDLIQSIPRIKIDPAKKGLEENFPLPLKTCSLERWYMFCKKQKVAYTLKDDGIEGKNSYPKNDYPMNHQILGGLFPDNSYQTISGGAVSS